MIPCLPFLFTVVREALESMLKKAKDIGITKGFEVSLNGEVITHLQFPNDTMLCFSVLLGDKR